jgi:Tfp pilus assembly protein PilF
VHSYSQYLAKDPRNHEVLLKRGITYYEAKEYKLADKDFRKLIELKKGGSDVYYFKGMVDLKSRNYSDASLYFSEAITENTSVKAVTKSIEELAILKIEQRDFYEAFEVLKRRQFLEDAETAFIDRLTKFVEGVIFLMKRKFDEAIVNFDSIEKEWFEHPRKVQ